MELPSLAGSSSDGQGIAVSGNVVPQQTASSTDQAEEPQPNARDHDNTDLLTRIENWWQNDGELDILEQSLQSNLTTAHGPSARRLLRNYTRLKSKPMGELFNFLLAFRTPEQGGPLSDYQRLDLKTSLPLKSCIDEMRLMLLRQDPPSLQICTLISVIPDDIRIGEQSFASKLFTATKARTSIREAPLLAILSIIQFDWMLPSEVRDISQSSSRPPKHGQITIPSQKKLQKLFPLEQSEWTTINISWLRDVVEYNQDVAIYVWEPHLSPLLTVGAVICISPGDLGPHQVLVVLRPSKRGDNYGLLEELKSFIPAPVKDLTGDEIEITSTLLSIYSLIISDTCLFIERLLTLIDKLAQTGRRSPSKSLFSALEQLSTYSSTDASVVDWIARIEKDLEYLQLQLVEIDSKLGELRNAIKAELDLRQIRLSRLLTVLAAIYLPFSFVSGFFGMNISSPLWKADESIQASSAASSSPPQPSLFNIIYQAAREYQFGNNVLQSDASSNSEHLTLSPNLTQAIISATPPTQYYFTFKNFLNVAFALTFITIILPLIAGDMFRILIRTIDRYKSYWRVLVFILGVGFVVVAQLLTPLLYGPLLITFGIPQVLFAFYILYRTECRSKRWIAYSGILSTSLGYDIQAIENTNDILFEGEFIFFSGFVPPLYLLVQGIAANALVILHPKIPGWKKNVSSFIPKTVTTHPKEWVWALTALWIGISIGLCFVPAGTIFYAGYSVVLGLYGLGKTIISWKGGERLFKWTAFIIVVVASAACDYYQSHGLALSILPFFWLICIRYTQNDQAFITRYFPKWMNLWKPRPHSMPRAEEPV